MARSTDPRTGHSYGSSLRRNSTHRATLRRCSAVSAWRATRRFGPEFRNAHSISSSTATTAGSADRAAPHMTRANSYRCKRPLANRRSAQAIRSRHSRSIISLLAEKNPVHLTTLAFSCEAARVKFHCSEDAGRLRLLQRRVRRQLSQTVYSGGSGRSTTPIVSSGADREGPSLNSNVE
jgi:hypothetical protein